MAPGDDNARAFVGKRFGSGLTDASQGSRDQDNGRVLVTLGHFHCRPKARVFGDIQDERSVVRINFKIF